MNNKYEPIISIYKTNSKLFINSFDTVTEANAIKRPNKKTNSMIFIALHILDARFFILNQIGLSAKNPFEKYIDWVKAIDEIKIYPKLRDVLSTWKRVDKIFIDELNRLTPKRWNSDLQYRFPNGNKIISMVSFLAEHEAYHVGQLALIRKFLGYPATSYE